MLSTQHSLALTSEQTNNGRAPLAKASPVPETCAVDRLVICVEKSSGRVRVRRVCEQLRDLGTVRLCDCATVVVVYRCPPRVGWRRRRCLSLTGRFCCPRGSRRGGSSGTENDS
eukprot:1115720-Pyramimonas_sp.AAC.1